MNRERKSKNSVLPVVIVLLCAVFILLMDILSSNAGKHESQNIYQTISQTKKNRIISEKDNTVILTAEEKLEIIKSSDEYPDELKWLAENNSETIDFVYAYTARNETRTAIDLTEQACGDTVPLLLQWDERWGYEKYGDSFMAYSGCGPVSLSMVAVYLRGDASITPLVVADFALENGYRVPGNGSSWTLISEGCKAFGLEAEELPLHEETMKLRLDAGCPIIVVVGPGDFTSSGHFMVITGYDENGFRINDPNSIKNSDMRWSYERIEGQIRNLWAMYKA